MSLLKRIHIKSASVDNTGMGTQSSLYGGRYFLKNGRANIRKKGLRFLEQISWYHTMLSMPRTHFLLTIVAFYILINLLFACVYLMVGMDKISGMVAESSLEKFGEAFFFSAQTFTTVGYGRLSPTGFFMSFIASLEALIGLLSFAVATGLMYGRFSKHEAFLKYSDNALIAPYKEGTAFMFRLAPYKNNNLSEAEVKLTLALIIEENGQQVNKFYPLKTELEKINTLNLNWTIVHAINEQSPLFGLTIDDLVNSKAEVLVFLKAFDDSFSNTVVSRSSYTAADIIFGARFVPMYQRDSKHGTTVLNLSLLNIFEKAELPSPQLISGDAALASQA